MTSEFERFGHIRGRFWGVRGRFWGVHGASLGCLGAFWGPSWAVLGRLGVLEGVSGAFWGRAGGALGLSWERFGSFLACSVASWNVSTILDRVGNLFCIFWRLDLSLSRFMVLEPFRSWILFVCRQSSVSVYSEALHCSTTSKLA